MEFLKKAEQGYVLFGMAHQPQAVCFSTKDAEKIICATDPAPGDSLRWLVKIVVSTGKITLASSDSKDITKYAFDIT